MDHTKSWWPSRLTSPPVRAAHPFQRQAFLVQANIQLLQEREEVVKPTMRRPSKFNEEVAAFEARIASVKKGFDAKLEGELMLINYEP